ncbi:hypothetical protein BJ165DRAFT_1409876 [Panaeolus papilionaceus]|nr:hypothetical protein BJ165DRAFT_1409876 [Panaeolus papilionaceus]
MAKQCVLEKKLENIAAGSASFVVTDGLMDNIKSYVVAVLLSPKLSAYKGDVPKDAVIKVLLARGRLHIPPSYDHDANIVNVIHEAIGTELTQARSKLKKVLLASIKQRLSIFRVAKQVVDKTQCSVTASLCSKIAFMRAVLLSDKTTKYWNVVDHELEILREEAGGTAAGISHAFRKYLKLDKQEYQVGYDKADKDCVADAAGTFQLEIDDTLEGLSTSTASSTDDDNTNHGNTAATT